jgi:TonB family protein
MTTLLQNFALLALTLSSLMVCGQINRELQPDKCLLFFDSALNRSYYKHVKNMPTYRGGDTTLLKTVYKNLKQNCRDCPSGTVYVAFIIEADGKVTNKWVKKGFGFEDYNAQALKVVDYLTDWIPGQCEGTNVATLMVIPIKFYP